MALLYTSFLDDSLVLIRYTIMPSGGVHPRADFAPQGEGAEKQLNPFFDGSRLLKRAFVHN
jgi:hypothetical protein